VAESVSFLNNHWQIDCHDLRVRYNIQNAWLLNDWEAIAYSLVDLSTSDLMELGSEKMTMGDNKQNFTYAALGPGSGLGVAGLCRKDGILHPVVTEGGHVGFAPESELQLEILSFLHTKFDDRVSRERLLSGPGLVNIHEALCTINKQENPGLIAADIAVAGIARTDPTCSQTLDLFFEILGQVAGDVALDLGAFDGIFIGGGIAQRYPKQLLESKFRAGFENKGRHSELLERIPTHLITHKNPGLIGASVYAGERLKHPTIYEHDTHSI
jgi:glucokinase